jgi:hypothetical protein
VALIDPHDPRSWARHWPAWDWHDLSDFLVDDAYERGRAAGRAEFAGEMLPALRWLLAGVDVDVEQLHGQELDELLALLTGPFEALMARHLRRVEQHQARRVAA